MIGLSIEIPDGFLNEEIRSDYQVTRKTKEIWAVELDLLYQFDLICKKYELKYFAGAGTLLGAVRHQGFIPWDDDMDFYMLRTDYDKLVSLSREFKYPYFLQNAYTDPTLMRTFCRLRNSCTTACTSWDQKFPVNKGIFIDISPLDGINENWLLNKIQKVKDIYYQSCFKNIHDDFSGFSRKQIIKHKFANLMISINAKPDKEKYFVKYENNLRKYSNEKYRAWGNRTLVFDCPKSRRPIEDWNDIIWVPFEFTQIPIPRNYKEILSQQYGDYMLIPRDKTQGRTHGELFISTDYSFDDPRRVEE